MEQINKVGWERLAVWFIYLLAQFLVLSSLLLTTTDVVTHVFFIIFSLAFYFITAIREPGTFEGKVQPNHEDVELSLPHKQSRKSMPKDTCKSEKEISSRNMPTIHQLADNKGIQAEPQKKQIYQRKPNRVFSFRPPSVQNISEQNEANQKAQLPTEGRKGAIEGKKGFKLFDAAKSVFGNISNMVHKKKDQAESVKDSFPNMEDKIKEVSQKSSQKKSENAQQQAVPTINVIKTQTETVKVSSNSTQKKSNSAIDKEDFERQQQQIQNQPKTKGKIQHLDIPNLNNVAQLSHNFVQKKINNIKHYCRICETYQDLRVKHCHSCQKCIATFDHHCPWMGTCIGEKNKLFYLIFIFFQTIQVLTIVIDLIVYLSVEQSGNKGSVAVLLIVVILLLIILTGLFVFHFYLVAVNLTTWQFMKWQKVEYLSIFDRKKVTSPFNKGFKENIKQLFDLTLVDEQKKWIQQISQDLSQYRIRKPKACRSAAFNMQSDRRPFRSQKAIS